MGFVEFFGVSDNTLVGGTLLRFSWSFLIKKNFNDILCFIIFIYVVGCVGSYCLLILRVCLKWYNVVSQDCDVNMASPSSLPHPTMVRTKKERINCPLLASGLRALKLSTVVGLVLWIMCDVVGWPTVYGREILGSKLGSIKVLNHIYYKKNG